jgi:ubiquinone/menaquinone biosynthesis C-methylase UbiE
MNIIDQTHTPAEVYEKLFVPALFQQWGPIVAESARIKEGDQVLDVACGTGVLACCAADQVGSSGKVTGLDANADMLAVARRKRVRVEWIEGKAELLPFAEERFDAVVSQFGLMFFDDRAGAIREMMRVLRPGGRLAVAVCDTLEHSPGYGALAQLLHRLFGNQVADAFRAPFILGDPHQLLSICTEAGVANAQVTQHMGSVRFASIQSLISTERACVWTLGGMLDDTQFARLLKEAEKVLKPYAGKDGVITFAMPALIVTANRP